MTIEFDKSSSTNRTANTDARAPRRLPLIGVAAPAPVAAPASDVDIEAELRAWEEAEGERLGLRKERKQWTDTMATPSVKRSERETVTLLISGLTVAQDFLLEGALGGVGYNVKNIGCPDSAGLQTGKEFGNRAQCNPTYFTVGNVVKYLIDLRDKEGMSTQDIIANYVFLTAGAGGPCRFGMYVTEYRKALRDAGFDGFRVMLFQQQGGLSQATGEDVGLEMNPKFFISILKAIVSGDVLNALGYRIRPYEIEPGETNRAMEEAKKLVYAALHDRTNIFVSLAKARKLLAAVKVDKLRPRAKVSIIGEFWAMTTEGDGNYHLQRFLESEGGENDIQLTTAWLLYNIWEVSRDTKQRQFLRGSDTGKYGLDGMENFDVAKRLATMRLADRALRIGFQAFAQPAGLFGYHLPDMELIAQVADQYYSNDLRGGEGHMEVGKLIVNSVNSKAHVTVSVKPFGCMPSSGVSDGVQSLITSRFPGTIFCAVETSGDGATNFYSRVQMYMFKGRILAEQELQAAYEKTGLTEADVRAFLEKHPRFASPLHHSPHTVAGSAANLVYEVAPLIQQSRVERAKVVATRAWKAVKASAQSVPGAVQSLRAKIVDPEFRNMLGEDAGLIRDVVKGRVKARFAPLIHRLTERAVDGAETQPIGMPQAIGDA